MRIKSVLLRSLNYSSINTALKTQHTNTLGYVWNSGGTKVVTDKGCGVLGLVEDSSWAIIEATGCGLGDACSHYPLTSRSIPGAHTAHRHQPQRHHLRSSVSPAKAYSLHSRLNSRVPFLQDASRRRGIGLQWAAFVVSEQTCIRHGKQGQGHRPNKQGFGAGSPTAEPHQTVT